MIISLAAPTSPPAFPRPDLKGLRVGSSISDSHVEFIAGGRGHRPMVGSSTLEAAVAAAQSVTQGPDHGAAGVFKVGNRFFVQDIQQLTWVPTHAGAPDDLVVAPVHFEFDASWIDDVELAGGALQAVIDGPTVIRPTA